MLRFSGKLLQILGLALLPVGVMLQLAGQLSERAFGLDRMLIVTIAGVSAFCLGRLIEGHARS